MTTTRFRISVALGALVLVGATACGESQGEASSSSGMTVSIAEPADGASIQAPFTLRLNSSVPLGPTESGNHHVHLYFDGDDSKYEVVEADMVEVSPASPALKTLSSGTHEMNISLRNADHSAAGAEAKITVQVGSGGAPAPQPPTSSDSGGYGGGGY